MRNLSSLTSHSTAYSHPIPGDNATLSTLLLPNNKSTTRLSPTYDLCGQFDDNSLPSDRLDFETTWNSDKSEFT